MSNPVIVSATRTATGRFGGALIDMPAAEIGGCVISEVLTRCNIESAQVDEVIMGVVYQGGQGANPARQAAVKAGLSYEVPAMSVNKLCGSGLKAIALAAQTIRCDEAEVIVAGGMENMSNTPYILPNSRWGERLGHGQVQDLMLLDGLWDCFYDCHMGITAENLAEQYHIEREEQDQFALHSQTNYQKAFIAGHFKLEIASLEIAQKKGDSVRFEVDEHPHKDTSLEKLTQLKPAFKSDGSVTAGNASGINDGAAAVAGLSEEGARSRGLRPWAHIRGTAAVGVDPRIMGIGPAPAIRRLLDKTGMKLDDIELFEINEAFAAQTLAVGRELGWDWERVNVNGGAIALGHAVGASGARVVVTLLHEMERRQLRWGIAALCIGGGMGIAALFERAA